MSQSELKAENARLAARVAELEAQLAAKPPIDRVSLYRMVNNAPWGVMAINTEGLLDYANPPTQRWLTKPAPAMGEPVRTTFAPDLMAALAEPVARALSGDRPHEVEVSLRDVSGQMRDLRLHVTPRGGGRQPVTGALVSLYDVTDTQALDRTVRENEARLSHINAVTPTVMYIFDVDVGFATWVGGPARSMLGYTPEEIVDHTAELAGRLVHAEDRPLTVARYVDLNSRPDGDVVEVEMRFRRKDGSHRWMLDRAAAFERDASGRLTKTIHAIMDIDERKRAEERRGMLLNELNHRVKNTLAAVQSIARQTLRAGRPTEQAQDLFTARLIALSEAHNVLTRENWEGAGLREIVEGALRPFVGLGEGRIAVSGPELWLGARAALGLAMGLHELATNAVKYGALSVDSGHVDLSWHARKAGEGARLELEWRESGGPPVAASHGGGFGSRLLTQGLPSELEGTTELDFAPEGVVCRIAAPLGGATPLLELA